MKSNDLLTTPTSETEEGTGPERTCILTRACRPKEELIRLALGPGGQVAPDVRARAGGRGAWIGVARPALETALAKGKLKGALSRAFKTGELDIPADLGERVEAALKAQALDRLGLEARSGTLLTGAEKIEQAARQGKVHLLIHAADAGADGNRALDQAWRVGGGPAAGLVFPEGRTILSMALGRENVVHVALTDAAAARRVATAIDRWQAFIDPDTGLNGGATAASQVSADELEDEGNA
ncbi:DUF448 domain-containing protein [Sphingomonas sp. LY160]|uniref:DUF448 domain-containing protein n=1 Tax=Sphingomonas sp. LY160 TaxID=3095342 RepID=UPI002ADEAE3D|nr:DUF448 domain-containing protein [Sphingomonas sp. LY160]MEA1071681.1 DUF448 domain-containing protein [Sphingomonas sp. LY160]